MHLTKSHLALILVTLAVLCQWSEAATKYHPRKTPVRPHGKPGFKDQEEIDDEQDMDYWLTTGMDNLEESLGIVNKPMPTHAKNVVIFVGDGMSAATVSAAGIYKAQQEQDNFDTPETSSLTFETFEHQGLSKTYSTSGQVPDSAATATAIFSGVKTNSGKLGFDENIHGAETMDPSIEVTTILTWAQEAGMDTGVVSTARLTHATPAALYSHVFDRSWECDSIYKLISDGEVAPDGYTDIASQLIYNAPGNQAKVLLGGGYPPFFPKSMREELREEYGPYKEPFPCFRDDEVDLTQVWLDEKQALGEARFVMNQTQLMAVDPEETDYLFGVFGTSHVMWNHAIVEGRDPSISEMTEQAVRILKKGDNGFFLMVEGGRIDHAHHANHARTAFDEVVAMDHAVEKVMELLEDELDDTLIIVTADHSHTMTFQGYPARGNIIQGLSGDMHDDGKPYTTMAYSNGLAYYHNDLPPSDEHPNIIQRLDLTGDEEHVEGYNYAMTSSGESVTETHGGDDVLIFARGPGAQLFHQTHEESHIANVMAYSACIGQYTDFDDDDLCQQRLGA